MCLTFHVCAFLLYIEICELLFALRLTQTLTKMNIVALRNFHVCGYIVFNLSKKTGNFLTSPPVQTAIIHDFDFVISVSLRLPYRISGLHSYTRSGTFESHMQLTSFCCRLILWVLSYRCYWSTMIYADEILLPTRDLSILYTTDCGDFVNCGFKIRRETNLGVANRTSSLLSMYRTSMSWLSTFTKVSSG